MEEREEEARMQEAMRIEEARRNSEMNMFAAMANGDLDLNLDHTKMNMNSNSNSNSSGHGNGNGNGNGKNSFLESNMFNRNNNNLGMGINMNMNGAGSLIVDKSNKNDNNNSNNNSNNRNRSNLHRAKENHNLEAALAMFQSDARTAAAAGNNNISAGGNGVNGNGTASTITNGSTGTGTTGTTGTGTNNTRTHNHGHVNGHGNGPYTQVAPPPPPPCTQRRPVFDQMYTEKVVIQRPLFFGGVLPASVVQLLEESHSDSQSESQLESKSMSKLESKSESESELQSELKVLVNCGVDEKENEDTTKVNNVDMDEHALADIGADEKQRKDADTDADTRERELRHIEGAVEAFGSISLGYGMSRRNDCDKMNSHVCLYEPVWGDEARLRREDRIRDFLERRDLDLKEDEEHGIDNDYCDNHGNANVDLGINNNRSFETDGNGGVGSQHVKDYTGVNDHEHEHEARVANIHNAATPAKNNRVGGRGRSFNSSSSINFNPGYMQGHSSSNFHDNAPTSPPSGIGFTGDAKNIIVSPPTNTDMNMNMNMNMNANANANASGTADARRFAGDFSDPSSDYSENLFLQYARGDSHGIGGTFVGAKGTLVSVPETDTLRNIDAKGSFEASELKKHIGLNDNLTRALEAIVGKEGNTTGSSSVSFAMEATEAVAAEAVPTVKDGRPLSNLEITNGKVPLYGCDDAPLPNLVDLFIPDTKGDQIRSYEQYESEEIISSQTVPNVFGPLVCPSCCSGPDDSQSWFSRRRGKSLSDTDFMASSDASIHTHRSNRSFDSLPKIRVHNKAAIPSPLPPPPAKGGNFARNLDTSRTYDGVSSDAPSHSVGPGRPNGVDNGPTGWWSIDESASRRRHRSDSTELESDQVGNKLQAPPKRSQLRPNDYGSLLSPSQEDLLRENRSLSELHPAISTVAQLPLLSDRPPSTRFIQIDTQVVGFPSLGEIEPFFCSMAIWYVEPFRDKSERGGTAEKPLYGRITESLCFDVASEQDDEAYNSTLLHPSVSSISNEEKNIESFQSTRCGVFPIQSCYEMKNLYAVLIVQKVLSDDSDMEIYWNSENEAKLLDLAKCRNKVSRAVDRVGHILTPFAFGVAPLAQILSSESPVIPTSKAAQIPLFKLNSGEGEDPIINHIIAISQPR